MPLLREELQVKRVKGKPPLAVSPKQTPIDEEAPKICRLFVQTLQYRIWKPSVEVETRIELPEQSAEAQGAPNEEEAGEECQESCPEDRERLG